MTQPNFLQVQTSLDRSCAFTEAHPGLSCTNLYKERLFDMRARFAAHTAATDRSYTAWRNLVASEATQYRDIKRVYDHVVELADEHGYDDVPRAQIIYTDEQTLFMLVNQTIVWMESKDEEWDWLSTKVAEFRKLIAESKERKSAADDAFQMYTVDVKRRVNAYDDATALLREFLKDATPEAKKFDGFGRLQLDVL